MSDRAGDDDLAQDFTQETFIRAFDRIGEFRGESAFSTWLHAVATSVIFNGLRKLKRVRQRETDLEAAESIGHEAAVGDPDLKEKLTRAVDDLPVKYRMVFVMREILRRYIERADAPDELKAKAIFWLGQHRSPRNQAYLREIYPRLTSHELKDKVIFSISQMRGEESGRWLMGVVNNPNESMELRKQALFWAGQKNDFPVNNLVRLYDTISDRELKEHLIFVYSQRRESEAVDKLIAIAENDRDKELREKAIFWLGQSKDPRVVGFLIRLINR